MESAEMSQITQLQAQLAEAFERLRSALAAREAAAAPQPGEQALRDRIAALESENAELADELERLRVKRDKDVAALDDLIAQLKPLIEEV
jgi:phage regulator Rha-like protein